jgi:hypothetical protein
MYIRIHLLHLFNKLELDTPNLQTKAAAMLQSLQQIHSILTSKMCGDHQRNEMQLKLKRRNRTFIAQDLEVEHSEKFSTWLKHKLSHDNSCNFFIYLVKVQTDPPKKLNT